MKTQAQQLVRAVEAFKTAQDESSRVVAPVTSAPSVKSPERRGPNRAKNVVRPGFGASANKPGSMVSATSPRASVPSKTGTDDWVSF
jgi:methyl-accepting chemotaxis protein